MSTRSRRSRRGGHGGGGGGGGGHGGGDSRWLVTYADLLTLLMVLFLVLWVISTLDLKKFEQFKSGLGDFGNPAATEVQPEGGADATSTTEGGDATTTTAAGANADGTGGGALTEEQLGRLAGSLQQAIDQAGLGGLVSVDVQQRGLVISVTTDDVLFEAGSAELGPEAAGIIGAIAPQLATMSNSIVVEGYTDRRPLRRDGYDNWDLSADRALSVVRLLRDSYGIAPQRLAATGYGDQHPVAEGDDEASYAKNRRVQIVVVASEVEALNAPATSEPTTAAPTTSGVTVTT